MKKTVIIILAIVLILVGGIWLYLLLFGAPSSTDEFFADLGFGSVPRPTESTVVPSDFDFNDSSNTAINTEQALNRLTLRPVAGAVIIGTSTTEQKVRYTEKGTGKLYEIDLRSNTEKSLYEEILAETTEAIWSSDGMNVVLVAGIGDNRHTQLLQGKTNASSSDIIFTATDLAPDAYDFGFSVDSKEMYYLRTDSEGSIAYTYSIPKNIPTVWFSLPFTAPAIEWSDTPLVYNRPGEGTYGYAYHVKNGSLVAVGDGGQLELTAKEVENGVIVSGSDQTTYRSTYIYNNEATPMGVPVLPEKCTTARGSYIVWCGYPLTPSVSSPILWYKGLVSFADGLWKINYAENSLTPMIDLTETSGQNIDVINPHIDSTGTRLIFQDKNTNILWLYDSTKN